MCGGYRIRPRSIYRLAANAVIITDFVRSGVGCGNVEMAAVRVWRVWDPAANGPNEYVGRGLRPKHGVPNRLFEFLTRIVYQKIVMFQTFRAFG